MQDLANPCAAVREIARVLAAAGTFIGIEPDNTANQIYFDGVLGCERCDPGPVQGTAATSPARGQRHRSHTGATV
jgi:hypothetical protein